MPVHNPFEHMSDQKYRVYRTLFERDQLAFSRFFLRYLEGVLFIQSWHYYHIVDALRRVLNGEITRLIINIPPGMGKTEFAVIYFVALAMALYPRSRFIHSSSGEALVMENSQRIKDVIKSEHYQKMWQVTIKQSRDRQHLWHTEQGGGFYAATSGSNIAGFRAGRMEDDFSGAFIYDDPLKPEDIFSVTTLKKMNRRFMNTIRTRLAKPSTPIIVIMQRLHEDDLSGFLLRGGSGDKWHHLELPVYVGDKPLQYPIEYTHGVRIPYYLPEGPLFSYKYDAAEIEKLKVDQFTFWAQYMQRPQMYSGGVFHDEHWRYYKRYDAKLNRLYFDDSRYETLESKMLYGDTAMKAKETNDYSVLQMWGRGRDTGNIYLLDQLRGRWETPRLKKAFMSFNARHDWKEGGSNMIGVRARKVEDKVSGTTLIQSINNMMGSSWIQGIPRNRDKVSRARACLPALAEGKVWLPESAYWLPEYKEEFKLFKADMTHPNDDQIDPTCDAIEDLVNLDMNIESTYRGMCGELEEENTGVDYVSMWEGDETDEGKEIEKYFRGLVA